MSVNYTVAVQMHDNVGWQIIAGDGLLRCRVILSCKTTSLEFPLGPGIKWKYDVPQYNE